MEAQRYTITDLLPLLATREMKATCIWRNKEDVKLATIHPSTHDGYFFIWWIDGKTATQTELVKAVKIEYLDEAFAAADFDAHAAQWLPERCTPWSKLPFDQPQDRTAQDSYVYFIQGADKIKIGIAQDPQSRFENIQNMSPIRLRLLAVQSGGYELETELHKRFDHLRQHGEWFSAAPELMNYIEGLSQFIGEPVG